MILPVEKLAKELWMPFRGKREGIDINSVFRNCIDGMAP